MTKEDKAAETASKWAGPIGAIFVLGALWYILFSKKP